jgi:hypothetical protein
VSGAGTCEARDHSDTKAGGLDACVLLVMQNGR